MDGRKLAHAPTTIGPDFLNAGEPARLFPVLSESSREGRALSILLSCMRFAPAFGGTLIAELATDCVPGLAWRPIPKSR